MNFSVARLGVALGVLLPYEASYIIFFY
ncbi:hypothetical protein CGLO_14833 [Colletotrichum gloeosporioides Cg-14]|uniref:Uncharacterized protein n=1 Tax=Colletotrichum gloeosporioides (strain Cg-14) TaxID=1237896 RepID=T0LCV4_COLGC|nr:hypothetical protein CGLO_14833 [Colletotrichum gloeosporioides Cg-14]